MYSISIKAVGALKEGYLREAEREYLKRLKPFAKIATTEIPETLFSSQTDRERVSRQEAQKIFNTLPDDAYIIALAETGKKVDSIAFAEVLRRECEGGRPCVFIIGGPLGLHAEVIAKSHLTLSLSLLTFTHRLARIVLLEQLYRAMTIIHGKKYHY